MFTVCPKCALTLVVTAADLRVAQGYVRCGRCSSVFNALARLTDDRQTAERIGVAQEPHPAPGESALTAERAEHPEGAQSPAKTHSPEASQSVAASESSAASEPASASEPAQAAELAQAWEPASAQASAAAAKSAPAPPASPAPAPMLPTEPMTRAAAIDEETIPESALEFDPTKTDVSAVFVEPPPDPGWTAATGSFKAMIAGGPASAPEPTEPDTVRERPPPPASPAPPRAATSQTPPAPAASGVTAAGPRPGVRPRAPHSRPRSEAERHTPASPRGEREDRGASGVTHEDASAETQIHARVPPVVWGVAAGVAALLLLVQVVNHYRDELAVSPPLHGPLTALYAALGVRLAPRWDLRAYDVRQLGASVDPATAGLITVRASVKNAAQQPQPLPLLRVTLQDRFGNRIAARDVAPGSYLPHAVSASSYLAPGQRIDAEMGFVDPGSNAVGFEIDACLPSSGGVACANDRAMR